MEILPVELRREIIERLDIPSLKHLRLTCKEWAVLGDEYLISSTFTSLPHRPDLTRLSHISQHPKFRTHIRNILFNHAEINEYHARHNTYFLQFMRETDERNEALSMAWEPYASIKQLKEKYLSEFSSASKVEDVLHNLPNLHAVEISLMECPFEKYTQPFLFQEIWQIPSTRLLARVATTERFTNIMLGLSLTPNLQTLSHDRLPFEFFAQRRTLQFANVFQGLRSLQLAIDYSDMPNNLHNAKGFQNLSTILQSITNLYTLALSFYGRRKLDIAPLLTSLSSTNYIFTSLVSLSLQGIASTEEDLGNFLTRQSGLKRLVLGGNGLKAPHQPGNGGVYLSQGSFGGLVERVKRETVRLERFELQGDLREEESGEAWVLEEATSVEELAVGGE